MAQPTPSRNSGDNTLQSILNYEAFSSTGDEFGTIDEFGLLLPSRNDTPSNTAIARTASVKYLMTEVLSYDRIEQKNGTFTKSISTNRVPTSFEEAVPDSKWRIAMEELDALDKNGTWSLHTLPQGKKLISCKWVYKINYKPDGQVERYKARLVLKGYNQVEGIDYHETFAPVAKHATICLFLTIASTQQWHLHQLDVNNAFLNRDLDEHVYLSLPPGFGRK